MVEIPRPKEYTFRIEAYTPDTIPMTRLAQYMADLARFLGESESVHFVRVEDGSVQIVHKVEYEAVPKVTQRIKSVRRGEGPADAMDAYRLINRHLRQDNSIAQLTEDKGAEVIPFPGRRLSEPVTFGAFNQDGNLDGVVIRLGGPGDVVPVHLDSGPTVYHCSANRDIAKRLARHIFDTSLRVYGTGRWHRNEEGKWELDRFTIRDFTELDDTPLMEVVERLRNIQGSQWHKISDPWSELIGLRGNGEESD